MLILGRGKESFETDTIPGVQDVFTSIQNGELILYLQCHFGSEVKVAARLPKWIHDLLEVVPSDGHVFLRKRAEHTRPKQAKNVRENRSDKAT